MASLKTTQELTTVSDLLKHREWQACLTVIATAFAEGGLKKPQEAFLYYARTRCLNNLDRYDAAVVAGQTAVFKALEVQDHNLLGLVLLELAWAQHKTPGLESLAIDTQRQYLEHFILYTDTGVRDRYMVAQVNLGVYMRSAGRYHDAYEQFKLAYQEAKKHKDHRYAQIARSAAVWEALRLERVAEAETLMEEGKPYDNKPADVRAAYLMDAAQVALLRGRPSTALEYTLKALPLVEEVFREYPDFVPRSLEILHRALEGCQDPDRAIAVTIRAKYRAEEIERHDLVAQLAEDLRRLGLQYPDAMSRVIATLDGEIQS